MSDHLNPRLDFVYKELTGKFEALDTNVMTLDSQVDDILDNDSREVIEHENLEKEAFLVKIFISIGSSHWRQSTPSAEHRSTSSAEHRSTLSAGHRSTPPEEYRNGENLVTFRIFCSTPTPPISYSVKSDDIDRHHHDVIDRQQQRSTERHQQPSNDRQSPMTCQLRLPDLGAHRLNATQNPSQTSQPAYAPEQEQLTLVETSFLESVDRRYKPGVDRIKWTDTNLSWNSRQRKKGFQLGKERQVNKVEFDGFYKRVKSVLKDMSFEVAYHKYILGNFFRESRETDKDIELLFNKVSRKPKRTLKKEQGPGKFLIPCCIHSQNFANALCDTGSAVNIMAIDTAELLGLKMEPCQDSFTFLDNSNENSAGMIKNVNMEIGECIIHVDFHVVDIK
ncbi:hypothetical protein IGI04_023441 [Brassica rapa subsp. trilocularis]|uniref:Aspartic peptidase DDI1-type domain-containing protein n=1 Tax=Brassica rapa subsp. trilocularis TaxID=1813537 RepID=A0ABQ7M609_BRACM|nr:hypothetical protein IGI04_023441 [Brassica rapa subsp. trilocularis]